MFLPRKISLRCNTFSLFSWTAMKWPYFFNFTVKSEKEAENSTSPSRNQRSKLNFGKNSDDLYNCLWKFPGLSTTFWTGNCLINTAWNICLVYYHGNIVCIDWLHRAATCCVALTTTGILIGWFLSVFVLAQLALRFLKQLSLLLHSANLNIACWRQQSTSF